MKLHGKAVDLPRLQAELAAAGIVVPALGTGNDLVHTYDESGVIAPLPPEAAAVIATHVPPEPTEPSAPRTLDERIAAAVEKALAKQGKR